MTTIPICPHERGNTFSHAFGVFLSLAGAVYLLAQLRDLNFTAACYGCVVYLISMLAVYTSSTFYHGWMESKHKEMLHKVDHACVYIFIAGTATPFLTWVGDPTSWSALGVVWAITGVGVYLSFSAFEVSEKYTHWFAGILAVLASATVCWLATCMPIEGVLMFMAGVTTYMSGMYFYLNRTIKHHHVLWHMAVLVGSVLHYFTVMLYVLPTVQHC